MQPNTPHYVLTVEDSIVYGRHMYPSSVSQSIAFGIIHTFILSFGVTNTLHNEMFTFLRRLMAMWYTRYKEEPAFDPSTHAHVPNIAKESGLKDVMAIGNLLELGTVVDRRSYTAAGLQWAERPEMGSCRWMYRKLQSLFAQRYTVTVGGKSMHPLTIFRRSLVEFAAAVVVYKEDMEGTVPKVPGCSATKVRDKTKSFFRHNYPELLPRLEELIEARTEYLYWTGPKIAIQQRSAQSHFYRKPKLNTAMMKKKAPHREFADQPLYPVPPKEMEVHKVEMQAVLTDDQNGQKANDGSTLMPLPHQASPQANNAGGKGEGKVKGKGKAKENAQRSSSSSSEDNRPKKRLRRRQ